MNRIPRATFVADPSFFANSSGTWPVLAVARPVPERAPDLRAARGPWSRELHDLIDAAIAEGEAEADRANARRPNVLADRWWPWFLALAAVAALGVCAARALLG